MRSDQARRFGGKGNKRIDTPMAGTCPPDPQEILDKMNFDPSKLKQAEFLEDLHHIANHSDLTDSQKLLSLQMLINKEYGGKYHAK